MLQLAAVVSEEVEPAVLQALVATARSLLFMKAVNMDAIKMLAVLVVVEVVEVVVAAADVSMALDFTED